MHPLLEHTRRWRAWARSLAARHARIADGRRTTGELLRWPRAGRAGRAGRVAAQPPAVVLNLTPNIHLDLRTALTRVTARSGRAAPARRGAAAHSPAVTAVARGRAAAPAVAAAAPRVLTTAASPPASETAARWPVLGGAEQTLPARSEPARPEAAPAGRAQGVQQSPPAHPTVRALTTVNRQARHAALSAHVAAGGRDVRRRLRRAELQAVRARPTMVLPPAPVAGAAAAHPIQQPPPPEPRVPLSADGRREPGARGVIAGHELERLADQVVRQIDRRITAHRERFGRI